MHLILVMVALGVLGGVIGFSSGASNRKPILSVLGTLSALIAAVVISLNADLATAIKTDDLGNPVLLMSFSVLLISLVLGLVIGIKWSKTK